MGHIAHPWCRERERERSVYLHQTFSVYYRLKRKRTMILYFEITQTDTKPYISNQSALLICDAGVRRDKKSFNHYPQLISNFHYKQFNKFIKFLVCKIDY